MFYYSNKQLFKITEGDKFIFSVDSPKLPTDMNGVKVYIDDILILHHNKHIIKVGYMEYCGNGV